MGKLGLNLFSPLNQNCSSYSFRFNLTIPLFMDVFFVAVFLFLSGCHILIEKNAISISGRYYIAIFENRKEKKLLKTTKMLHYLFTYFVSQHRRIFCRLVLISVSQPPTYYLLKLKSE